MSKAHTLFGSLFSKPWLAVALLCLVAMGGCATRQNAGLEVDTPPLMVADDDSAPLNPAELAALNTTGQIDKNIPPDAMPDVLRQYKYFLHKGRKTMSVFSKRSEQYLSYARKVFRSRGMPEELAYLAIVESGYRVDAKSPVGAAGAWQFMPYTGMKYGLNQDWWMDERLDPYKSTEAAADYLQKLYGDFNDWPTAIAAYNAGEGKISRAKKGTGGRNFYEVKARNHVLDDKAQLRDETKQYVPRFIAVAKIMRNLPQLGFAPVDPENAPGVLRFTARPGTDLGGLAKACGMSREEFNAYNRHHKQSVTTTERASFVYVPARYDTVATAFLRSPQAAPFADWRTVQVATSADSWDKISRRCNVPLATLKAANAGNDTLLAGETVLVPRSVNMSATAVAALDARSGGRKGSRKNERTGKKDADGQATRESLTASNEHVLQADETLLGVARKYNVSIKALQVHNDIEDPNKVRAGKSLRIPGRAATGRAPAAVASAAPKASSVALTSTASRAEKGRTAQNSASAAPLERGSSGKVGKAGKAQAAQKTVYTVQAKDSLWHIARKYNVSVDDLKRWNNVDEKNLRVGTALVVNLE